MRDGATLQSGPLKPRPEEDAAAALEPECSLECENESRCLDSDDRNPPLGSARLPAAPAAALRRLQGLSVDNVTKTTLSGASACRSLVSEFLLWFSNIGS